MPSNDFSNLPPGGSSPDVLAGDRYERAPYISSIYVLNKDMVPTTFPMQAWNDQSERYIVYWNWFTGEYINQKKQGEGGQTLYKFPLRINSLRDIVRKQASLLFGEAADGPDPLVKAIITARGSLNGDKPNDAQKKFAALCENLVNEVWSQSNGKAIQFEGGELNQFLGGHYYQLAYEPWRDDLILPIVIHSWKADMVLPVWSNGDYWDLSEAYIVCRVESSTAKAQYGVETSGAFVTFVEHWTKTDYSIFIDNEPITLEVEGKHVTFDHLKNPFGFVPIYYVPHLREGSFYGSSHVPDLVGLIQEYNASMANLGDAIADALDRERYIRNSSTRTDVTLPNGKHATNLGMQNPAIHDPPDAWTEDPPQLAPGLVNYPAMVYQQIRRTAFLPTVAEGEDEGSQRSGTTLDIRFWPATSHAKAEQAYWEMALNLMARGILRMVNVKNLWKNFDAGLRPDNKFLTQITIGQAWNPQIPRDRESIVNEAVTRLGAHGISLEKFIEKMGDTQNPEEEIERIKQFATFLAGLDAKDKDTGAPILPLNESQYAKNNQSLEK